MSTFTLIYIFLQKYLVPFVFAVGLFYFVYGAIEYFIIGKGGDEGRAQHGRELFLKSIAWFVIGLFFYMLVSFFGWLATLSFDTNVPRPGAPQGGLDVERNDAVLPVPNVPTR